MNESVQYGQRAEVDGTYSCGLHIGDGRTGLDRVLPAAEEREEQLGEGAAAIVGLQGGRRVEEEEGERREEGKERKERKKIKERRGVKTVK